MKKIGDMFKLMKPERHRVFGYAALFMVLVLVSSFFMPPVQAEAGKGDLEPIDIEGNITFADSMVGYVESNIVDDASKTELRAWRFDRDYNEIPSRDIDRLAEYILSIEPYSLWTFDDWDANIQYRGIDHKETSVLEDLLSQYYMKNAVAVESLQGERLTGEELSDFNSSLNRIYDKFISCYKELEFREQGLVKREIHHTVYYIDLDGGNDGSDGLSTGNAWLTIEKYTTTTVRSAGDIAWVRANTDETVGAADIAFDEDGTISSPIEIRGCSSAGGEDPWSDGSDVKPIIDFNTGAYQFNMSTDDYWRFYRLDIKNGSDTQGLFKAVSSDGLTFDTCHIHQSLYSAGSGLNIQNSFSCLIDTCVFDDNYRYNIYLSNVSIQIDDSTFDGGGTNSTDYGLYLAGATFCIARGCAFGDSNTHDSHDIYINAISCVDIQNSTFNSSPEVGIASGLQYAYAHSEDHDGVKGAQASFYSAGTIERDSVIQLDSLDSAKMTPASTVSTYLPLTLANNAVQGDYQLWCPASETTVTIKARETAAWTSDPSSSEFYFVASYYDEAATSAHRTTVTSSQSLSGTSEISFTLTFTPAQAGWVYIWCYLEVYESGKSVNVSVQPTVS